MRFVDVSVFVYAFLKPRRKLTPREAEAKERARRRRCSISAPRKVS